MTLDRRLGEPFTGLDLALIDSFALGIEYAQIVLRIRIALIRRLAEPVGGLEPVGRRFSRGEQAKPVLGFGLALPRCLRQPEAPALRIGLAQRAIEIDFGKRILRPEIVLLGGLRIPVDCLIEIGLDAKTLLIEHAKHRHGARIARLGRGFGDLAGTLVVLVFIEGDGLLIGVLRHGRTGKRQAKDESKLEFHGACSAIACISSVTMRMASSGDVQIESGGRMKSGCCVNNAASCSGPTGSTAMQGTSNRPDHQAMIGSSWGLRRA